MGWGELMNKVPLRFVSFYPFTNTAYQFPQIHLFFDPQRLMLLLPCMGFVNVSIFLQCLAMSLQITLRNMCLPYFFEAPKTDFLSWSCVDVFPWYVFVHMLLPNSKSGNSWFSFISFKYDFCTLFWNMIWMAFAVDDMFVVLRKSYVQFWEFLLFWHYTSTMQTWILAPHHHPQDYERQIFNIPTRMDVLTQKQCMCLQIDSVLPH